MTSMLRFIENGLYGPRGYFRNAKLIVGASKATAPLNSATKVGRLVAAAYEAQPESQFGTASSLFRDAYASALVNWSRACGVSTIVEVGGGNGALAADVLSATRDIEHFHHVEISPELAAVQRETVRAAGHSDRHSVHVASFLEWIPPVELAKSGGKVAVVAFEVFDNLACEKLVVNPTKGVVKQAFIADHKPRKSELYNDLVDDETKQCLQMWLETHPPPPNRPDGFVLWLPLRQYQFVRRLKRALPKARVLICDFDSLPSTGVVGTNAPVIQRAAKRAEQDDTIETFDNLLNVEEGSVDVMFSTSFDFVTRCFGSGANVVVEKHADYLAHFAPTMSQAMARYYLNMSVLRTAN